MVKMEGQMDKQTGRIPKINTSLICRGKKQAITFASSFSKERFYKKENKLKKI
jgi:hypothetical protein